jgi:hypothetical protein
MQASCKFLIRHYTSIKLLLSKLFKMCNHILCVLLDGLLSSFLCDLRDFDSLATF